MTMGSSQDHRAWLRRELVAAIRRLAGDADEQLEYLRVLGSPESADELALEFDDVASAALAEPALLSDAQAEATRELAARLEAISGPPNSALWTPDGLRTAPEWDAIRHTASRFLATPGGTDG